MDVSNFPSFINPTESVDEEDSNLEMVFHNEALLKLVGIESTKDLHALLSKHMFISQEQGYNLSLLTAAQSRYSDLILSQTYKYVDRSFRRDRIISF